MLRMPRSKSVGVVATVAAVALLASSCGGSGGKQEHDHDHGRWKGRGHGAPRERGPAGVTGPAGQLHRAGVAVPDPHPRRARGLQARRRRRGLEARRRPRDRGPDADRQREDLHVHAAAEHQVLRRQDGHRGRRQGDLRAPVQDRRQPERGHVVQRHQGRRRVHQDAQELRPHRRGRRQRQPDHVPPHRPRPRVPAEARGALRVHPAEGHAVEERRLPAARHRPVQVDGVRARTRA